MHLTNDIYQRIASAKIFIDKNYCEAISLDEISQQAFLFPLPFSSAVYKNIPAYSSSIPHSKKIRQGQASLITKQTRHGGLQ